MTEKPDFHPDTPAPKIGVLLVNLGTPDEPTVPAVRRYLAEFLSDKRVIEIPDIIWKPILYGLVLSTRPRRSAAAYAKVWMEEGSPLAVYTKRQVAGLQQRFGDAVHVSHAMRYGRPGIGFRLEEMKALGCERILFAPLYPQYCGATTATAVDEAGSEIADMRWQPTLRTLPPYHDDSAYIDALAASIRNGLAGLDFEPEALIASFHGMPRRTLELGDPYHCQCQKTSRLLSEKLNRPLFTSFQSRFGNAKWLEPATADLLEALPAKDIRKVAIFAPGFSVDCLETLEELAMEGRDQFTEAGGTDFAYIPCLNASDEGMAMLETIVRRELSGWIG
ncbi:ferrochelatase [Parasphingopyxis algicola]|uniref:ferrochelatase n=1 Tax=Parasphingopyxis algicola TaxID=2026624 RepID=UPI0015A3443F|nr:ferrochelatase [Parasphingopyxis algicola]QLC26003.1 ferrochelatase [Parasphingopyxis algicola]